MVAFMAGIHGQVQYPRRAVRTDSMHINHERYTLWVIVSACHFRVCVANPEKDSTATTTVSRHRAIKDCGMLEEHRSRIIIADDHTLIAEACKQVLERRV